jgi:hypothetical protein
MNDQGIPLAGVIVHPGPAPGSTYTGRQIMHQLTTLSADSGRYRMRDESSPDRCLPHRTWVCPAFERDRVIAHHVPCAWHAKPAVVRHHGSRLGERALVAR